MKNLLLLLLSFGLVFLLIPNASLIGASLIIYFGILFLDFAFFSFFSEEILVFIEEQKILERITFVKSKDSKLVFIGLTTISIILFIYLIYDIVFLEFSFDNEALLSIIFLPIMCYFFPKWLDK